MPIFTSCMLNDSSENACPAPVPLLDNSHIIPGMYVFEEVTDSGFAMVFKANGIYYQRQRLRPDDTNETGLIATEQWRRWSEDQTTFQYNSGGRRINIKPYGWPPGWDSTSISLSYFKQNVTGSSFTLGKEVETTDGSGEKDGCVWGETRYIRIGDENHPWPSPVNWPEAWPH